MLKYFKFYIISIGIVFASLFCGSAFAAPICPVPREFTQPNGDVITVTSYGDEFFSWSEDEKGNVIAYDEKTDSYKYAEINDDRIVPTSQTAGEFSLFNLFSAKIQREDIMPLWENAERVDYSKPVGNNGVQLMSADDETQKPLTDQPLLAILIEFNDVQIKYGIDYWHDKMFDKNTGVHSVVNYWKENSNGLEIFKPSVTEGIKKGDKGTVSNEDYTDINYEIKECLDGVVYIYLDMPHPVKKWSMSESSKVNRTTNLAIKAIEKDFDFKGEKPHLVTIFAGYDGSKGEGEGQISAYTQMGGMRTSDGTVLSCVYLGERLYDNVPTGMGSICHELGHSAFGLPDLYPQIFQQSNGGINEYSLMSIGCLANRDYSNLSDDKYATPYDSYFGHMPTHLDPWSKIQCGFITPTIVNDWDGDINSISPDGENSKYNVIKIISKTDPTQYFLVENRQLIGFDRGLECVPRIGGGIIIWHIDENVSSNNNHNSDYHHFMQIEPSNNSSPLELEVGRWRYTNEDGRNKFNSETAPNSNLHERVTDLNYACSYVEDCHPQTRPSGVSIEVLGDNSSSMRVKAKVDDEYVISFGNKKFSEIFPDENFCMAILDIIEENSGIRKTPDSIISSEDAIILMSIKDLDLNDRGIRDLRGIEQFPILEWLRLERNELTEIDTTQVPNLVALFCNDNKIKGLDVSNLENLMYFDCSNNLLTEIDISNNKYLYSLWCSGNDFTELNTGSNPELWDLYCFNNKLTKLDVTNNKELCTIQCYDNYMDNNPETAIGGLAAILPTIGAASTKDDENENYDFIYYPQKTPEETHTHTLIHHTAEAATCTESGTGEYWACEGDNGCNKMFSDANGTTEIVEIPVIAAPGHSYDAWSITVEPTDYERGYAERICKNDSAHKDVAFLPVLTNETVWTAGARIEPAETADGSQEYNSIYGTVTVILPATGKYDYSIKYEDGKAVVTVPQDGTYTVIFASYDNAGGLLSVSARDIQFVKGENPPISPQNFNTNEKVKVMLWDSLMSMKPLCAADGN